MCEQSETSYLDGAIVWVKLGSCWWPGEVVGSEKLPPDLLPSFRKPPIAVVKFFQEDTYEYVKNLNSIFEYNCSRKNEFINKGLYMYRTKHGLMEKFPEDVIRAETAVGGDIKILTRDEFQETKKESYAGLFGDPKKTPISGKKGKGSSKMSTPIRKHQEDTNYKVHILLQGAKTSSQNQPTENVTTPSTSRAGSEPIEMQEKPDENKETPAESTINEVLKPELPSTHSASSTPTMSNAGQYACHACQFTTTRLNVLILHNKTHSISYIPYTPSPVKKKPVHKTPKSSPTISKTPKSRKPRQDKPEKAIKKPTNKKRAAEPELVVEIKKLKTDEEIKSSLLADWDDGDEESNDESSAIVMARSPEVPVAAESPAVPIPAELPSALIPEETETLSEKKSDDFTTEKPESSSDSKYEFCEDEDWPIEADVGRKIPRIKNPSKRKSETKSVSIDDDEMEKEVAELLNKTTVPELPSAPEPLKVEENFPEPSIVKSPDKKLEKSQDQSSPEKKSLSDTPPTKTIFKTKTFFRSRHSRSQDAIGKYVAEQLNAAERMDLAENDLNGASVTPPLEVRVSPAIDHVKIARLAPKIQLKRMKAEAAQLREREKYKAEPGEKAREDSLLNMYNTSLESSIINVPDQTEEKENSVTPSINEIEPVIVTNKKHEKKDDHNASTDLPQLNNTEKYNISIENIETEIKHDKRESQDEKCKLIVESENISATKLKENDLEKPYDSFINESTASAVDALLSVSREADRVTKVISDDPPEDLFEEDIKDNSSVNGFNSVTQKINQAAADNDDQKMVLADSGSANQEKGDDQEKSDNSSNVLQESNNISDSDNVQETTATVIENRIEEVALPSKINIEEVVSPTLLVKNNIDEFASSTLASKNESEEITLPSENDIVEVVSHTLPSTNESEDITLPSKNDIKEVVSHTLPSTNESEDITLPSKNDIEGVVSHTLPSTNESEDITLPSKNDSGEVVNHNSSSKNESEEVASHNLSYKNDIEEVVSDTLLSNDIAMSELVSNDIKKCYPSDNTLSESDLQIAETLINLPTTTLQNKSCVNHHENNTLVVSSEELQVNVNENAFKDITKQNALEDIRSSITTSLQSNIHTADNDSINSRFETEQEKSENLNAAKSLVQMSESIDHKIKIPDIDTDQPNTKEILNILQRKHEDIKVSSELITKPSNELITRVSSEVITKVSSEVDHKNADITNECKQNPLLQHKSIEFDTHSSKLLKILEEPCIPKVSTVKKTITKQVIVPGKEKILNFEVGKSIVKPKHQAPKQKIIIRRTAPSKTLLNNITEVTTPDKIILSRTSKPAQDGSPVQTYTIQTTPEPPPSGEGNTIIIQQKIRKISKPMSKLQKIKSPLQTSSATAVTDHKRTQDIQNKDEGIFDINSMPVVLSDDILTPESIEKMPIVMSDGNIITNSNNPPKLVKTKQVIVENEKVAISAVSTKSEIKTLLMNSSNEVAKVTTPNILSKSSKLRGAKPMLVIDKVTGKQKIIMTKQEPPVKDIKQPQTIIQSAPQSSAKGEKFIILPTQSSPRPGKTQKIVIDPQTGKAHVLVGKGAESPLNVVDNKPVSAKLIPSASDASTPGSTVMIITNAQGTQSRIVLTPEHEKILFPNKQQNVSQLKTVTHRVTSGASSTQKAVVTTPNQTKTQTRMVPKQKNAIITSKGQLIVGGRIATQTQNIAPMPEIRPTPKRILAAEPKKLVQTIQKNSSERLIFLQQKSGAVMQLTAAQFEHLQRTGQIIQKAPQEKVKLQKSMSVPSNETVVVPPVPKQRMRKSPNESPTPSKKVKHEIAIAPALTTITPIPALTPLSNTITSPAIANLPSTHNSASTANYSELDNIEELLPSTAIARQDIRPPQPEITAIQSPALSDPGQLLAVPGEHFGGPPGSFYLCVEENGTFTVIDPRPLVLENNQLVPMAEPLPVLAQPERRDILEAALANSDVFHAETAVRDDAPDFRDLNANVSVHCRVSETSTTLNQPIMTPVEVPSKGDTEPTVPSTIEDGLAVIGVTPLTVPTSLELPITVTDPRIAPKTTDPLSNNNYSTALLTSPNTELTFATSEQMEVSVVGPISMPLLTEEDAVGKSMPILTDEVAEKTVSSVESTIGSPSSIDVRESENEDGGQWPRQLLTPCSDTSETSAEIPLQPVMQLSVNDFSHSS